MALVECSDDDFGVSFGVTGLLVGGGTTTTPAPAEAYLKQRFPLHNFTRTDPSVMKHLSRYVLASDVGGVKKVGWREDGLPVRSLVVV